MAAGLHFFLFLCLTAGLWTGLNAGCESDQVGKTCPSGWTQFEDHCYIFKNTPMGWVDAELACIGLGGNLASIPNQGAFDLMRDMIRKVTGTNKQTWVGGHDTTKEGVFLWIDGHVFDFNGWAKGEPSNYLNNEHCMEMNFRDLLNDSFCHLKKPFMCGKKPCWHPL